MECCGEAAPSLPLQGWAGVGAEGRGQAGEAALLSALVSRVTVTTADLHRCAEC